MKQNTITSKLLSLLEKRKIIKQIRSITIPETKYVLDPNWLSKIHPKPLVGNHSRPPTADLRDPKNELPWVPNQAILNSL